MPSPVRWLQNLTHPEVQRLQAALRERLEPLLTRTLENGLYVGQHLAARVVEVEATDAGFSTVLPAGFPQPVGLTVWRAREKVTGALPPSSVPMPPWEATRVGDVWRLSAASVSGLTSGTTYLLTLAVYAG